MMSIKTNKEYDALVAEIDNIKNSISTKETELLETIEAISKLEEDITSLTDKASQVKDNNEKQLGILQEKIDSIGSKVSVKVEDRKKIISNVFIQLSWTPGFTSEPNSYLPRINMFRLFLATAPLPCPSS